MVESSIISELNRFKVLLRSVGVLPEKIILFGSYANDTSNNDSDVDIIVISKSFKNMDYWQRINVLSDAICEGHLPIEATAMTQEEFDSKTSFITEYAKNGIVV